MNVFNLFRRRGSAPVAKERLQILLSYERASRGQSDLLAVLREDILAALTKHITVERENVQVRMDRGESVSTLEIEVEIPNSAGMLLATASWAGRSTGSVANPPCHPQRARPRPRNRRDARAGSRHRRLPHNRSTRPRRACIVWARSCVILPPQLESLSPQGPIFAGSAPETTVRFATADHPWAE